MLIRGARSRINICEVRKYLTVGQNSTWGTNRETKHLNVLSLVQGVLSLASDFPNNVMSGPSILGLDGKLDMIEMHGNRRYNN